MKADYYRYLAEFASGSVKDETISGRPVRRGDDGAAAAPTA